jgi:hypothetical protein
MKEKLCLMAAYAAVIFLIIITIVHFACPIPAACVNVQET